MSSPSLTRRCAATMMIGLMMMACVIVCPPACRAAEAPQPTPVTTADPAVPIDRLKVMLRPLTKDELAVEVEGWMGLLKQKVQQIADAELGVKKEKERIDEAERKADEAQDKADEAEEKVESKDSATPPPDGTGASADDDAARPADSAVTDAGAPDAGADPDAAKAQAEQVKAQAEAEAEQAAQTKEALLDDINELRDQQTALIDRTRVVLNAYKVKGGEIESQEKYIAAVSGLNVDVADAGAAWAAITGWLGSKEGGLRWLKNIGFFFLLVLAFWIIARIIGGITEKALNRTQKLSALLRQFLAGIVRKVIFIVGFIVALSMLEIDIGPMLAAIGAIGFIVAFAMQETLGNFAAGVMILLYRPFDVGDFVDIGGTTGTVKSLSLVSTTLTTPDNKVVIVPNNKIWGGVITNFSGNDTRRVDLVFGISYNDDLAKAQGILETIVKAHPLVLGEPAPVVKVHELANSSVNFVVRPWVKTSDYWSVYWNLTRSVKEKFDEQDITIPYPQQDVYMHQVAVPA